MSMPCMKTPPSLPCAAGRLSAAFEVHTFKSNVV
jgi:hypothetical protein